MATPFTDVSPSGFWSRAFYGLFVAVIASFILTSLYAKWNPVMGGDDTSAIQYVVQAPKKNPNAAKGKKNQPDSIPSTVKGPIPVSGNAKKLDFLELANIIDAQVAKQMAAEGIKPSPRSEDAEFLRRVYLDLVGVIPSADKVDGFLKNTDPRKREKVIDELLADPRFGKAIAEAWSGLMIPRIDNNRRVDHTPLQKWLAKEFNDGVPLNKLVFNLLVATGDTDENGATAFFVNNPTVDKMTDASTRFFLGVQLQCAQCHNHPFTDWKQTEYWGMAAFFMKTKPTMNPMMAAKKGVAPGITDSPVKGPAKKQMLPDSAKIVPAKFLQGESPKINPLEPSRPVLARWITSPTNPFFARAMVNRFWYQLFGRGLVNPVDDMHQDNPPTHPELLAALTDQLKANGFDTKYLVRAICNSETYQRSSRPTDDNKADERFLSHRVVRVLSPEQFFDSLTSVVGMPQAKKGADKKGAPVANLKKGPANPRDNFLMFFRIDEGADPLEYQAGIPQALRTLNSPLFNNTQATVAQCVEEGGGIPKQIIKRIYLHALSRPPTEEEVDRMLTFIRQSGGPVPRPAYNDMLWALLNSSEFALNH
jgi:Protein of unknown function (DUF1553)/Protein of unknown function (DUF1549)